MEVVYSLQLFSVSSIVVQYYYCNIVALTILAYDYNVYNARNDTDSLHELP